jgi:hypothetical protein
VRKVFVEASVFVFAETYTALLVRVGRAEAIEWSRRLLAQEAFAFDRHFVQRGLTLVGTG